MSIYNPDQDRLKMMADKLMEQVATGNVDNEWAENFITDVHGKLKAGRTLTDKQVQKLEELFEEY